MGLYKNKVGRPSNETKAKRKSVSMSLVTMGIAVVAMIVGAIILYLTK